MISARKTAQIEEAVAYFESRYPGKVIGLPVDLSTVEGCRALAIPAIKSFLSSEVEQMSDASREDWTTCSSCHEPVETADHFCKFCGASQTAE